ncbi:MAG: helix-turn-helix domain-containing protein [Myxococcota bacterium]
MVDRSVNKRDQLVRTSVRLFAEHGFHATGIDRIAREAAISKRTLYQYFRTKDELILAALRHKDGLFRNDFVKAVEAKASAPTDRLLAIFDVANDWFLSKDFFGCMFVNAVGEHSSADSPVRRACIEYKRLVQGYIRDLAEEAGLSNPAAVAEELALLFEGATVTAQVSGQADSAAVAKRMAHVLIERHTASR